MDYRYPNLDDEKLMELFQNGDVHAFNTLYNRYYKRVFHFLYRFNQNMSDCEDLVQETFLRVYKSNGSYNHTSRLSTWIYTIAQNLSYTSYRKRVRMELVNFHTDELQQNHEVSEVIENNDNDPEEIYQRRYVLDVFRRALQSISQDFKQVIVLRDLQGLSYEEISDATGMPMGTVKSKINRGRYQLQKKMGRLIEEPNKKRRKVSH